MLTQKSIAGLAVIILLSCSGFAAGKNGGEKTKKLNKTDGAVLYTHFNINNISTFIFNNGEADIGSNRGSGLFYPKGGDMTAVFESGLVWGARVDGQLRAGGSTYGSGLMPGKIISPGVAVNPDDIKNRVYRVRPDYKTADLTSEVNDFEGTAEQIRAQYKKDWNEWPAADGAPYDDINNDGRYEPSVDVPGIPGAAQTLWFVANDLDSVQSKALYGSLPMGIEMQVTVWGYTGSGGTSVLSNTIFKKYKLINKSGRDFTDMYFGYWSDVDDGNAGDDLDGCDTLLNLGYTYNANAVDASYNPLPPPAVGFSILQGPAVPGSPGDKALVDGRFVSGLKNLGMTSLGYIFKGQDARIGKYEGTQDINNFLRGRLRDSSFIPVPPQFAGASSLFPFSGDPAIGYGWLDGVDYPAGDRRIMVNSGPFNMAPADTQEVVYAEILAGAVPGMSNLSAVTLLKLYTKGIRQSYNGRSSYNVFPEGPRVKSSEYDQSAVLTWGENQVSVDKIESGYDDGFIFEGYNIYQLPTDSSGLDDAVKIKTYDIVDNVTNITDYYPEPASGRLLEYIAQSGTDSGIKRFIKIDRDYINKTSLHNGTKYFYAVTAYNYNPDKSHYPRSHEGALSMVTVIPRTNSPGDRLGAEYGTVLKYSHTAGNGGGWVEPTVVDPLKLNGHEYKVSFYTSGADTLWRLTDLTTGTLKFEKQKNQSGDDDYLIADGILAKVIGDKNNPSTPADAFTFTAPVNTYSGETARKDVEKINVFPNPYYGYNSNEEAKAGKFVTFSHLPEKATIRIFDLAGRLVRTMEKDSPDQFYKFYLFTDAYTPLGSGIYIAYIDMPELGTTKILKFAIITPLVIPDHF